MRHRIIGQLGRNRWANGLGAQDGWFEIIVGPGETGWVEETAVGAHGPCADTPQAPLIMNRGAPANYRCAVMRSDASSEPPPVYRAANPESPLVARLGNWADVAEMLLAWYRIPIPTGGNGWITADQVELTVGCDEPRPERIQFPAGATATTIEGEFQGQAQVEYLFWAAQGQTMQISVTSSQNSVLFHVAGVADGQVLKHLLDGESSWQGTIPASQDYLLTLDNSAIEAT